MSRIFRAAVDVRAMRWHGPSGTLIAPCSLKNGCPCFHASGSCSVDQNAGQVAGGVALVGGLS